MNPLARWFERRRLDRELRREMAAHIEEQVEQLREDGFNEEQARFQAHRQFGNVTRQHENSREAWGWNGVEQLAQDLRFAYRMLAKSPGFTAVAVLLLALGIGANSAIFSFIDAIFMQLLPVHDPKSLVVMNWHTKSRPTVPHDGIFGFYSDPKTGFTGATFPFEAFELLRANSSACSTVFAYSMFGAASHTMIVHGQGVLVDGEYVSGEFFHGLGITPAVGRLIDSADDRPAAPAVVVISSAFWQRRFGGSPEVIGQPITIDNTVFTVAGVTPPEFYGPGFFYDGSAPDIYLPMSASVLLDQRPATRSANLKFSDRNFYWIEIMGRLRPGVSMAQAQAELAPRFHQFIENADPQQRERANPPALFLKSAKGLESVRLNYAKPLNVLACLVGLVLAIACANVASLLLARAAARRREIAVRLSIGASRLRLIRQFLTESVVLALFAGTLGILVAFWGIRLLTALLANGRDSFTLHAELNGPVLAVTVALSLLTGLLFGLAPAFQATRVDIMPALKDARLGEPMTTLRRSSWRVSIGHVLIAAQITTSLLLLIAASLFVRTLLNLQSVELGFNREKVLVFTINAGNSGVRGAAFARFYSDLQMRLSALPGVLSASLSSYAMLSGPYVPVGVTIPGAPPGKKQMTIAVSVGPSFFTTMQIPLLIGRELDRRDMVAAHPVAVVNEAFVNTYFGSVNLIGRHVEVRTLFFPPLSRVDVEVVGVARNSRDASLKREIFPAVYVPFSCLPRPAMTYEVRTVGDPRALIPSVRQIVQQMDARIPISDIKTQTAVVDEANNQERTLALLCTCFAVLALAIACVGIYGTVAYTVARRTQEIGIRIALGAKRWHVIWTVLREICLLSLVGVAIGVPTAYAASRLIQSLLFGMKTIDPVSISFGVTVLVVSVVAAAYGPARRASGIEPALALREE